MGLTALELITARDTLFKARAGGVRRVRDASGEEVEYRSDAEMARALAALDSEISTLTKAPLSTLHFQTSKGL